MWQVRTNLAAGRRSTFFSLHYFCDHLFSEGGKGELAFELVNLNDITATVVDPRPLDLRGFTRKLVIFHVVV
jgi:hypothetical protein